MPPKKKKVEEVNIETESPKKSKTVQKSGALCGIRGPGPKYKLKTLVGYNDHCASRYRNPAYSMGRKQIGGNVRNDGPGPIYYVRLPVPKGFSIGQRLPQGKGECRPGPYLLPDPPRGPIFSMKWRTKLRDGKISPGPYNLPSGLNGPAFTIGSRPIGDRLNTGPGPSPPYNVDVTKPQAPAFSFRLRPLDLGKRAAPGPYDPYEIPKTPAFSFGVKHSPCTSPFITECDEAC